MWDEKAPPFQSSTQESEAIWPTTLLHEPSFSAMLEFDPSDPEGALMKLADYCEENPLRLENIPLFFVNYFGIERLATSVDLILPSPPPFDDVHDR
jgi:hypothetical protein